MKRRFRDVIIYSDGSLETSMSEWCNAKYTGHHRTDALYNELGYRVHKALLEENGEQDQCNFFPIQG